MFLPLAQEFPVLQILVSQDHLWVPGTLVFLGNQTGQVGLIGRSFLSLQKLLLQKSLSQSNFKISKLQNFFSIVLVLELYENEELTW